MQNLNGHVKKRGIPTPPELALPPPTMPLPEPQGIKRSRNDFDYCDVEMTPYVDVSKATHATDRCVNSLSSDELTFVREYARDSIEQNLDIEDIELPNADEEYSFLWPKGSLNNELRNPHHQTITSFYASTPLTKISSLQLPTHIYTCCDRILTYIKTQEFKDMLEAEGLKVAFQTALEQVVKLLDGCPSVFPVEGWEVWRTIVTLNKNDETATILPQANVRYPTSKHEDLLRNALLLLPLTNRNLSQFLLSFTCLLTNSLPPPLHPLAKQALSTIFAPHFFKKPSPNFVPPTPARRCSTSTTTNKKIPWTHLCFELLMYTGTRHSPTPHPFQSDCALWRIPESLSEKLTKRSKTALKTPLRTPSRRMSVSQARARTSSSPMMIDQGSPNGSRNGKKRGSNRRLFGAPTTERVKKVEFVIGWVSVDEKGRAATEGIVLDRDVWCKRRRLDTSRQPCVPQISSRRSSQTTGS